MTSTEPIDLTQDLAQLQLIQYKPHKPRTNHSRRRRRDKRQNQHYKYSRNNHHQSRSRSRKRKEPSRVMDTNINSNRNHNLGIMHYNPENQRASIIPKELAQRLKISDRTIYNKLSNGTFPIKPIRIGRLLRFREEDINSYLKSL